MSYNRTRNKIQQQAWRVGRRDRLTFFATPAGYRNALLEKETPGFGRFLEDRQISVSS
jgi:hypothetical protein